MFSGVTLFNLENVLSDFKNSRLLEIKNKNVNKSVPIQGKGNACTNSSSLDISGHENSM